MSRYSTEGMTRRELLRLGLLGAASLTFSKSLPLLGAPAAAAASPAGKAKSVIQIWMWGGPTHLDTFDPKPGAGYDYCGPYDKPIATNVSGIQIGQMLPQLAKHADKYALLRSVTHNNNAHETASYIVQTGHQPGQQVFPSAGAVVSVFKGYDKGYKGIVPPYVVLTEAQGRFSESGFLGQRYKPFVTGGDPNQQRFVVEGIVAQNLTDERQKSRRDLLHSLDTLGKAMPGNAQFQLLDQCEENAYEMMFGEGRKLYDLSTEKEEVRQKYGRNTFGQCCLMARRLVEQGVPYITINYKGWDTHKRHFETMRQKLPEMDNAMAALLQELSERGLLDSTIVWWTGEFGRTPKVMWQAPWNGGRGHFGQCFSVLLAGGGFKGGQVLGASDATGESVAERPIAPQEIMRSIFTQLGINPDSPLPNARGLELPVMPPPEKSFNASGLLTEIM